MSQPYVPSRQFDRIAKAIEYVYDHFEEQPSLNEVTKKVHVSPFYLQRQYHRWVGISPKKMVQYISVSHAKTLLRAQSSTDVAAHGSGLFGMGRLHDLFVNIEGMTLGEYKQGGEGLDIHFQWLNTLFGDVLVAYMQRGHLSFIDNAESTADDASRCLLLLWRYGTCHWRAWRCACRGGGNWRASCGLIDSLPSRHPGQWHDQGYRWSRERKLALLGWEIGQGAQA